MKGLTLRPVVLSMLSVMLFAGLVFGQANDRGIITGLVTDSSGASVPAATVTVTNQDTSVKTAVASDTAGNYSTPPLVLGTYTVQVEKGGFKTFVRSGIILTSGSQYRQDIALELGAVSQTVEVKAASVMLNAENAEVSHTLTERYYEDLPAVMGADIRLAEALLQVQPGYIPMAPNGDAIFRGSQFQSRINGGQTMSTENWFDGASFGYAEGHQQTQESTVPYSAVKEMTVVENTFSAQYGHTSGGFIQYSTKSGTNQFHGQIYDYITNAKLDARKFFSPNRLPLNQNNWGAAAGGPITIPHVYNGKDRTFFFFNADGLDYRSTVNTGFVHYLPLPAERTGDFSFLLNTANQVGTDALGRPIYQGEIFNPATSRTVGGVNVRDGYGFDPVTGLPIPGAANIIPANDPLRSQIAAKYVPLMPQPDRVVPLLNQPNGIGGFSDDNKKIDVRTYLFRVDHSFNNKFKMSNTYYQNYRPRVARCGGPGHCDTKFDGLNQSAKNDTYVGDGFYQLITNHYEHLQFDWVVKPNVFNHTTLAYDRWVMGGHSVAQGVGWNAKLGITGFPTDNAGPPAINFAGSSIPYTYMGNNWSNGYEVNNRWQYLDDVTWLTGKHTIKAGFEFRNMDFPQHGWDGSGATGTNYTFSRNETAGYDAKGNNLNSTGDPFASLLLGQVDNANFQIPIFFTPRQRYVAPWVNDDIKLTPKLTLSLGLRFDYQSALTEKHNRFSTFDPNTSNPGAGGIPGALIFAGTGPGKSGKTHFEDPKWNVGPRFGFAYRVGEKNVIRGGYGIYYSGVAASQFQGYPTVGYTSNPSVPNVTSGFTPAYYWDGTCPNLPPSTVGNAGTGGQCGFPASAIHFPPFIDPTIQNGGSPLYVPKDQATLPRYQNWSLSFQHQITQNMLLDVAYVGNHGTRLVDNWSTNGLLANMNDPKVLALGANVLGADINSATAKAAGITPPYAGFAGDVAQALRLYPQYQGIIARSIPNGQSIYNALQVVLEQRLSHGLQYRVAYTWSHLINDGADAGQSGQIAGNNGASGLQNPVNFQQGERGLSSDDIPHYLGISWIYELPLGKGKRFGGGATGALDKLISGWKLSATQIYQAGRPLGIQMNNSLGPYLFNISRRPDKVGVGRNPNFSDPNSPDPNKSRYLLASGWACPSGDTTKDCSGLTFGNAKRTDGSVRGFPYYNEDLNLFKDTPITERTWVRFEAEAGNLPNRVYFCIPNQNWSSGSFGSTTSQCNIERRIQFGLTINF